MDNYKQKPLFLYRLFVGTEIAKTFRDVLVLTALLHGPTDAVILFVADRGNPISQGVPNSSLTPVPGVKTCECEYPVHLAELRFENCNLTNSVSETLGVPQCSFSNDSVYLELSFVPSADISNYDITYILRSASESGHVPFHFDDHPELEARKEYQLITLMVLKDFPKDTEFTVDIVIGDNDEDEHELCVRASFFYQ